MRDGSDSTSDVTLERPARLGPSWRRRFAWLVVVLGLGLAIIRPDRIFVDPERGCAAAVHRSTTAVQTCQAEYQRTRDPNTGVLLAKALLAAKKVDDAKEMATSMLTTPARSDALQLVGEIARREDRNDDALTALEEALRLHRIEQNPKQIARDDAVLAWLHVDRNEFAEALQRVDECIAQAQLVHDASLQCACHLTGAKTLTRVGYWSAAAHEIDSATPLATSNRERSDLEYQRANLAQEHQDHETAIVGFNKALRLHDPDDLKWIINIHLNFAYSFAERRKFDDAQYHLDTATRLDSHQDRALDIASVAAQIAYQRHDLPSTRALTDKYFQLLEDDSVDRDVQIDVATLRAQIELESGDLRAAEDWARRGVKQAELVRGTQSALELRPQVLTKRRRPYELLFSALASSRQVDAAALAFDQWQGRTVQDALTRPRPPASLDYRSVANQITRLGGWLRAASLAAFASPPDHDTILRTMHDIDLLALIVANNDVWRLTANHDSPRLSRLGSFAEVSALVERIPGHATEIEPTSRLGALLLPDDAFRSTPEMLHVIVDGRLGDLPMAALRHGSTPLIAMRPIVRLLRLPEAPCARVTRSGHATVLVALSSPNAVVEGAQVAELLHTTSEIGSDATRTALFAAGNDSVLHVAAHGEIGMDGAAIVLADGKVSALEISALRVAPSLAVLSACSTATSDDAELGGSLVAGFLGAGSQHVVAALGPVSDAGALGVATQFYLAGGVANPARALAIAQAELAKTGNSAWPYFAVFGPDVCPAAP